MDGFSGVGRPLWGRDAGERKCALVGLWKAWGSLSHPCRAQSKGLLMEAPSPQPSPSPCTPSSVQHPESPGVHFGIGTSIAFPPPTPIPHLQTATLRHPSRPRVQRLSAVVTLWGMDRGRTHQGRWIVSGHFHGDSEVQALEHHLECRWGPGARWPCGFIATGGRGAGGGEGRAESCSNQTPGLRAVLTIPASEHSQRADP